MSINNLGISGVLSGWDSYSTNTENAAAGPVPKKYTLTEILELIRDLKSKIDPERIEQLFLNMEDHIHDSQNPHIETLQSLGTSVLQELYAEWLARGHIGTLEEFVSVLFQYIQIANDEESLAGVSTTKIISVRGSKLIYEAHIADPDAHYHMFRAMLPGTPMDVQPIFSSQAFLGENSIYALRRVWVEMIDTNANFADWTDLLPDDYSVIGIDQNNYVVEHMNGMQIVSNMSHDLSISRIIPTLPNKKYEWYIHISNHVSGICRYQITDITNNEAIVPAEVLSGANTNGLYKIAFTTPTECVSVKIEQLNDLTANTDYVVTEWKVSKIPATLTGHIDTCYYHRPTGYLDIALMDTLPIDSIYGEPTYSIWGERTNKILHSATFDTGSFIGGYKATYTAELSPLGIYDASIFVDAYDNVTSEHGWLSDVYSFVKDKVYTISVYVKAEDKKYFTVVLPTDLAGPTYPRYDLTADETYHPVGYDTNSNDGECIRLPNNYCRVIHVFKAKSTRLAPIKMLFCDVIDGDTTYIGNGKAAGILWQAQLEEGIGASPALLTDDIEVTRAATIAYLPFEDKFVETNGTLVVTTKKPYTLDSEEDRYLYDLGTQNQHILRGRYPSHHEQKLFMESANRYLSMLNYSWSGSAVRRFTTYVHSYNPVEHVYGNTGNMPIVNTLDDNSVTPAELADYTIESILTLPDVEDMQIIAIDCTNTIRSSKLGTNDLLPQEILDILLETIYGNEKLLREANDMVAISILDESNISDQITPYNVCDKLWIGCDHSGNRQLDGYIKNITYYAKGSNYMNAEFHIGEYVDA